MITVTIADVSIPTHQFCVVLLVDEAAEKVLPLWMPPGEGIVLALGLRVVATTPPLPPTFLAKLLAGTKTQVQEVRLETLKGGVVYATVQMRTGKRVHEIEARPGEALALAVQMGCPIRVSQELMEQREVELQGQKAEKRPLDATRLEHLFAALGQKQEELRRTFQTGAPPNSEERAHLQHWVKARLLGEPYIKLEPYNPDWTRWYEEEKQQLLGMLGQKMVAIEHIGSTAVPGLGAQPIIDILIGVDDVARARDEWMPLLESMGYRSLRWAGTPKRAIFRSVRSQREIMLYVVGATSDQWKWFIGFRDVLRAHAEDAERYFQLKQAAAANYGTDWQAYAQAKKEFVTASLKKAWGSQNK